MRALHTDSRAQASFLVIRRDNIGDLVCTTALLHALRERFADAHALRTARLARPRHIIGFVHDRNYHGAIDTPVWKKPMEACGDYPIHGCHTDRLDQLSLS